MNILGRVALLFLFSLQMGCSGGPVIAPVKGKVTYMGKVIDQGVIMFLPEQGPPATGNIEKDGSFTLTTTRKADGAVVGKHKVIIQATKVGGGSYETPKSIEEENQQSRSNKILVAGKVTWLVPEKYSMDKSSTLTADVKNQPNTIDFDIKD